MFKIKGPGEMHPSRQIRLWSGPLLIRTLGASSLTLVVLVVPKSLRKV